MNTSILGWVLAAVGCFMVSGCVNTAQSLRSRPVSYVEAKGEPVAPGAVARLIKLRCVKEESASYAHGGTDFRECLYVTADANALWMGETTTKLSEEGKLAVDYLLSLSEMNCSNFMHRAFAIRSSADFTSSLLRDLTAGGSAAAAHSQPALSAGLSFANLFVGSSVKSFSANYYFDKTFDALKSTIDADRLRMKREIMQKLHAQDPTPPYSMASALSDVRAYDDSCSFMSGLTSLTQLAAKHAEKAKGNGTDRE